MILLRKLQAHSQVCVNGKLINLEKAPGMQVVSIVFSTQEGGMENVATRKCDSKETVELYYTGQQDERINMERDEMNEVGTSIYTT